MGAASNLTRNMERTRSQLETGSIDRLTAIANADELMYDFLRDSIGLTAAMIAYREIRHWSF